MHPFFKNIRPCSCIFTCIVLTAVCSLAAVDITLKSGATFTGEYSSQNENFIILHVGTGNVSIAKSMIAAISGLPQGVTVSLPEKESPMQKTAGQEQHGPSQATSGPFPVLPGQELEIKLKNGTIFKGTVITSDDRIINLQAENGSRINVYTHIISTIVDRTNGKILSPAVSATPSEKKTAPKSSPAASEKPQQPATTAPAPQTMQCAPASASSPKETAQVIRSESGTAPVSNLGTAGSAAAAAVPPVPVASVAPLSGSARGKTAAPLVASSVSVPSQPAATAGAPQEQAIRDKPKRRPDGKSELVLKNGTVFIGTIVSENNRFLAFSTSDGTTINIIRRLIKTLDGVPYMFAPGGSAAMTDTSPQLLRFVRTRPSNNSAQTQPPREPVSSTSGAVAHPVLPQVETKPGISANEYADSLGSPSAHTRAAAARQLGAMGPWATGSIPLLIKLLADTTGSSDLPPLKSDSISIQRLLAPGFEAARSLSRIGDQGIEELKKSAQSSNSLVRQRAVFGLAYSPKPHDVIPILRIAQKDPESGVRVSAAYSLGMSNTAANLISMLNDRDGDVRTYATAALATLADLQSAASMVKALKDTRPGVRKYACIALGRMKALTATAHLATALCDIHPEVRAQAAAALAVIADTAAVNQLCAALKDKNATVRKNAALALAEIRDPRAIPSLYSAIQSPKDPLHPVMEQVLRAHTEIPLLIAALDNSNGMVRENATYILWLMTGKDIGEDKQAWLAWYKQEGIRGEKNPPHVPKKPASAKKREKKR